MTDNKVRKRRMGRARQETRRASGSRDARKGNALVEGTHQVVEDEVRRGDAPADAPAAPGPDHKEKLPTISPEDFKAWSATEAGPSRRSAKTHSPEKAGVRPLKTGK